jgi:dTMP kinase
MKPLFIVLEGPDAAGKSTQLELLAAELSCRGIPVLTTREPGGTELGRALREIVLDPERYIEPLAELFIMLADRNQHVEEVIKPALAAGKSVICSRYTLSSAAYQGYGRGIPLEVVQGLNELATGSLVPDYTFLLDLPPEVALERTGTKDRFETEGRGFFAKVRGAYLKLIRDVPNGYVIDATLPPEEVCRRILAHLPLA